MSISPRSENLGFSRESVKPPRNEGIDVPNDSKLERFVKEAVKCKLDISCEHCTMLETCMVKSIVFYEGEEVAKKCPPLWLSDGVLR